MKHVRYMHAGAKLGIMSSNASGRLPIGFPASGCIRTPIVGADAPYIRA